MNEKNQKKENAKKHRVFFDMNLGTRDMKSERDYDRKRDKRKLKEMIDKNDY